MNFNKQDLYHMYNYMSMRAEHIQESLDDHDNCYCENEIKEALQHNKTLKKLCKKLNQPFIEIKIPELAENNYRKNN